VLERFRKISRIVSKFIVYCFREALCRKMYLPVVWEVPVQQHLCNVTTFVLYPRYTLVAHTLVATHFGVFAPTHLWPKILRWPKRPHICGRNVISPEVTMWKVAVPRFCSWKVGPVFAVTVLLFVCSMVLLYCSRMSRINSGRVDV
jgi:hypothetical protein